jgi:DNA-directed RNA polymerase subunit RPC12/RpoP
MKKETYRCSKCGKTLFGNVFIGGKDKRNLYIPDGVYCQDCLNSFLPLNTMPKKEYKELLAKGLIRNGVINE